MKKLSKKHSYHGNVVEAYACTCGCVCVPPDISTTEQQVSGAISDTVAGK